MIDYTIMEYNIETRKYTTIGIEEAPDSRVARDLFVKKNNWKPRSENIILFAKGPLCR